MNTHVPALTVQGVSKTFDVSAPWLNRVIERRPKLLVKAVADISFTVEKGTCFSIVGESGCGKSTVARLVTGLYSTTSGDISFGTGASGRPIRVQMIFRIRIPASTRAGAWGYHRGTDPRNETAQERKRNPDAGARIARNRGSGGR